MANELNVSTPSGSLNNVADGCNNLIKFSDSDLQTLSQCEAFAGTLLNITRELHQQGFTDKEVPPFLKADLLKILGISKLEKTLRGLELHEYLKSRIVPAKQADEIPLPRENINIDNILPGLKEGNSILQNMSAKTLHLCLNYGVWLNTAFQAYE